MASGAAPCSEQRPSADTPEKGGGGVGRGRRTATGLISGHAGIGHCDLCVVCGDRACNHHYYGVAACHGCKCFFWRSIKNKMKYICRGDGHCDINPNHRNACRFCRLQRCLNAGMQPDAVRMPKPMSEAEAELAKLEKAIGQGKQLQSKGVEGAIQVQGQCPLCHHSASDGQQQMKLPEEMTRQMESSIDFGVGANGKMEEGRKETPKATDLQEDKAQEERCQQLVKKLVDIEVATNEVADFSENEAPKRQLHLDSLFDYPEFLDRFRTQVNYCVRLRRVTEEEMEFAKYRTLTKVVDYIRALSMLNPQNPLESCYEDFLSVQDKVVLLRHGFAALVLFDMAAGTSFATKDTQNLLCLPTGLTLCAGETVVPNNFLSQQIVSRCISSLVRLLTELHMDQEEFVLLKLIIALALDSANGGEDATEEAGQEQQEHFSQIRSTNSKPNAEQQQNGHLLSPKARQFVEQLRDSAHAALYRHSPRRAATTSASSSSSSSASEAALRFAKLLHILPKLTLLSRDLVEHIRMVHTFPSTRTRPTDPLFFQLFGDIFNERQQQNRLSTSMASSPFSSPFGSPQTGAEQQLQPSGQFAHLVGIDGRSANPKMISPPYKLEHGDSPQQRNLAQPLPPHQEHKRHGQIGSAEHHLGFYSNYLESTDTEAKGFGGSNGSN